MVPKAQYLQMTNVPYTWLKLPTYGNNLLLQKYLVRGTTSTIFGYLDEILALKMAISYIF